MTPDTRELVERARELVEEQGKYFHSLAQGKAMTAAHGMIAELCAALESVSPPGTTEKVLYDDEVGSITWSAFSPHIWIPKEVADAFGKPNTKLHVRVVELPASPVTEEKEK